MMPSWIPRLYFGNDNRKFLRLMPRQFKPLEQEQGVTRHRAGGFWIPLRGSVSIENKTLHLFGHMAGVINKASEIHDRGDRLSNPETTMDTTQYTSF